MRDVPDLDARAVVPQAFLQPALDRAVVALLVHVDEVDDDQAGEVAQAELPRDFLGGLHVGLERGVLDVMLAGGAPGIDVDGDQRLGLVEHDVAARLELHHRREHGVELALDPVAGEDRQRVAVGLHVLGMARHEHAHEFLGVLVALVAGDHDLVDVLVVEVADRALDQRAFLVDQRRRGRFQRQVAHRLPQPQQIFEVALDLGLGAGGAGGAQDHAHAFRHFQLLRDLLELAAVLRAGDLAADAAAARRVRHQHRIAAGEREIGGERRALGAAFLLDHLHQHHLPALDHLLNLVLPAQPRHPLGHFLHGVGAADRFDHFLFALGAVAVDLGDVVVGRRGGSFGRAGAGLAGLGRRGWRGSSLRAPASAGGCVASEPGTGSAAALDSSCASSIGGSAAIAVGGASSGATVSSCGALGLVGRARFGRCARRRRLAASSARSPPPWRRPRPALRAARS